MSERGVSIGGNANVSGQIATGDHVTMNQRTGAAGEDAFAKVERLLAEHAGAVAEAGKAARDVADLRAEAAEDDPDTDRMASGLERLGARVSGVAALAAAVGELAAALGLPHS
ncbi:DUF5955 family protein [Actinomadura parmotrematis]|uniref:DUF3618 domain-containing protein n=1 Tax=Actinomadura parmotrematis TaxID=2864039 RepID=A0ABS7FY04_9ACTN|nr:DUF5955 family protein [Actinomadura parmotrematis]MBW8485313.1 hypothetical protein [Actinomadura parmotrematis]